LARIVLIGPTPPYRGGIAQYTSQLRQSVGQTDDLLTISYSRQYPAFLYPGKGDKEPGPNVYLPDVEYIIDSANPLSWRGVEKRIRDFRPDLIIVQWWHVYWAPFSIWARRLAERIGSRVVMICHNVDDHEKARWKLAIRDRALTGYKEFLVHSSVHVETLRKRFPTAKIRMHPIPAYASFPAPNVAPLRRAGTELLFFGLIRPYKGLDILLSALTRLKDRDFFLTIAGEGWDDLESYRQAIRAAGLDRKIEIKNSYLSDQDAANLFARADAVALPYRSASGSAVAAVALNYRKPVIASRVGGLPDIITTGAGILVEPENVDALADALARVMDGDAWYTPSAIDAINERLTWHGLASELKRT